jgi:hypothetical protein
VKLSGDEKTRAEIIRRVLEEPIRPLGGTGGRWVYSSDRRRVAAGGGARMLETIAIILIVLWLLGLVSSYTLGGFIHVLVVIAVVVILIRVIQGRRAL